MNVYNHFKKTTSLTKIFIISIHQMVGIFLEMYKKIKMYLKILKGTFLIFFPQL